MFVLPSVKTLYMCAIIFVTYYPRGNNITMCVPGVMENTINELLVYALRIHT